MKYIANSIKPPVYTNSKMRHKLASWRAFNRRKQRVFIVCLRASELALKAVFSIKRQPTPGYGIPSTYAT